jgi:hypothetical protein
LAPGLDDGKAENLVLDTFRRHSASAAKLSEEKKKRFEEMDRKKAEADRRREELKRRYVHKFSNANLEPILRS